MLRITPILLLLLLNWSVTEAEKPQKPAKYDFTYKVVDEDEGNDFAHTESRDGDVTAGEYHVKLPDGRTQLVEYEANAKGYMAKVTYVKDHKQSAKPIKKFSGVSRLSPKPTLPQRLPKLQVPSIQNIRPLEKELPDKNIGADKFIPDIEAVQSIPESKDLNNVNNPTSINQETIQDQSGSLFDPSQSIFGNQFTNQQLNDGAVAFHSLTNFQESSTSHNSEQNFKTESFSAPEILNKNIIEESPETGNTAAINNPIAAQQVFNQPNTQPLFQPTLFENQRINPSLNQNSLGNEQFHNANLRTQQFPNQNNQQFSNINQNSPQFPTVNQNNQRFINVNQNNQRFSNSNQNRRPFSNINQNNQQFPNINQQNEQFFRPQTSALNRESFPLRVNPNRNGNQNPVQSQFQNQFTPFSQVQQQQFQFPSPNVAALQNSQQFESFQPASTERITSSTLPHTSSTRSSKVLDQSNIKLEHGFVPILPKSIKSDSLKGNDDVVHNISPGESGELSSEEKKDLQQENLDLNSIFLQRNEAPIVKVASKSRKIENERRPKTANIQSVTSEGRSSYTFV